LDLDDCSQPMNTMSSADHETISNELETDENNNESNASKKKKSNKKVSDIKFPARLPTLSRVVEEQLVKGDPMSVYQDMIKSCAHFYIASDITCNKM